MRGVELVERAVPAGRWRGRAAQDTARALAARMREEDGVGPVLAAVNRIAGTQAG
ncbi:hypothetical protein ACQEVG_16210 [Streptomyces sp. CA-135486]|uniref:hypothetical protein n=1 Tax=Streptomyces sp. CA-135486 TaxID=3240049 RepID=UPI003D91339F